MELKATCHKSFVRRSREVCKKCRHYQFEKKWKFKYSRWTPEGLLWTPDWMLSEKDRVGVFVLVGCSDTHCPLLMEHAMVEWTE